ncbi:MAG TPA: YncE family protein [Candidatus Glassbacteria bacterium]|nr:YncE family protein [Candidatus Glassbacteria bacterium]
MNKKTFSLAFVLTFLTLLILIPFVKAPVGPLQIVATITLDKKPECIAVNEATNRIYIGVEDGLLVLDCDSYATIANITTEAEIIGLAINPQTNRIYAVVYGEGVAVIDGATNQIVNEIPETIFDTGSGVGIGVNLFTNLIYIEDRAVTMGSYDRVNVYDGETNQFVTSLNIPDTNTHTSMEEVGLAVNSETNRIYVTWSGNGTLHMFDGNTHEFLKTVKPASFSERVIVNAFTGYVYVGDVVLDGETLAEVFSDYEGYLETVDPVNNLLYTVDYHNLYVLNGTTHDILTSLELDWTFTSYTDCLGVNCETDKVYLVDNSENQIPVVIPELHTLISTMIVLFVLAVAFFIYTRTASEKSIHKQ